VAESGEFPACATTGDLTADLTAALHAARHGDEAGFVTIYRDVQPRLLRYATVLVGRDAAEDVTAEAWLQISRDLHKFVGDGDRFRGWAATIVHHRAMDTYRASARRPTPAQRHNDRDDYDESAGVADTAAVALDALSTDLALTLIAELPRQQAQAVLLRAVVGLDARTAGEVLGKRPGAVRVAAHRGLKKLARQLRYHPEEGRWTLV
jgi:RNA polymerase sigma-70 factor (ECF subfamily)